MTSNSVTLEQLNAPTDQELESLRCAGLQRVMPPTPEGRTWVYLEWHDKESDCVNYVVGSTTTQYIDEVKARLKDDSFDDSWLPTFAQTHPQDKENDLVDVDLLWCGYSGVDRSKATVVRRCAEYVSKVLQTNHIQPTQRSEAIHEDEELMLRIPLDEGV